MSNPVPNFYTTSLGHLQEVGCGGYQIGNNYTMNTSAVQWGFGFVAPANDVLTGFKLQIATLVGVTASGIKAQLYSAGSDGFPTGTMLASSLLTPAAFQLNTFTMAQTGSVTAGETYYIVISNPASSFTTDYFQLNIQGSQVPIDRWTVATTDAGSSWTNQSYPAGTFLPVYQTNGAYGYYSGTHTVTQNNSVTYPIYNNAGTRSSSAGFKCIFPNDVKIWKLWSGYGITNSPNYRVHGVIYDANGNLLGTSINTSSAAAATTHIYHFTGISLSKNTTYYIGIAPSGNTAGDASNYIKHSPSSTNSTIWSSITIGIIRDCYVTVSSAITANTFITALNNYDAFSGCLYYETIISNSGGTSFSNTRGIRSGGQL